MIAFWKEPLLLLLQVLVMPSYFFRVVTIQSSEPFADVLLSRKECSKEWTGSLRSTVTVSSVRASCEKMRTQGKQRTHTIYLDQGSVARSRNTVTAWLEG